ncbi:MAG: hypothetical protein Q9169_000943 [Polycauliona sp. 2 TL-2023]
MASKRLTTLLLFRTIKPPLQHPLRLFPPLSAHSPLFPHRIHPIPSHGRNLSTNTPSSPSNQPKTYTYKDIHSLSSNPNPTTLLIDVREPSELDSTGRIPSAVSMPIVSNPDAIYLSPEDFEERFGFAKPGSFSSSPSSSPSSSTSSSSTDAEADEIREQQEELAQGKGNPAPYAAGHGGADVGAASLEKEEGEEVKEGEEEDKVREVVFYCKAGVRSRAAMQMALGEGGWKGVEIGQWSGGWVEWEKEGGRVER